MTALAPTLQSFFTDYLIGQRAASPHTVTAYRDTFRMLLDYIHQSTGIRPSDLDITKLNAELIAEFLTMLEQHRGNCARTRNARLAAIHSLFQHAALRHPEHAELIARVLAIAPKNTHRTMLTYLTEDEVKALLATPNRATWTGRRDHLIILLMISTGLRVSELTSLTRADTRPESPAHITCHGKGRKDRITPLDAATAAALHVWLSENPGAPTTPVFTARGTDRKLTTDAVAQRLQVHTTSAARTCPPWPAGQSPHMCCVTPPRCACSPPGATSPRSRSGSVMNLPDRLVPTSTPTCNSNNAPSTAPRPHRPPRAATPQPTPSLPSCRPCSYAELPGQITTPTSHLTPTSA